MSTRKYTGWDGNSSGPRAGTEKFIDIVEYLSGGGLWKNGGWNVRKMRGKTASSVHGTGRATDLSWRGGSYSGYGSYKDACDWFDLFVEWADLLCIEAIFDYYPQPYGRGYKCDRDSVRVYTTRAFSGTPGGDWFHIEIAPDHADDPDYYQRAFDEIFADFKLSKPAKGDKSDMPDNPTSADYPGHVVGLGHKHKDEVMVIQNVVGTLADGIFGPATEAAVKGWQSKHGLKADGLVGPVTWAKMFGDLVESGPEKAAAKTVAAPPEVPFPGPPDIMVKSKDSNAVKMIQSVVGTDVDGIYGPDTRQKVRDWQARNGLQPDGRVGPRTWAKMFK